MPKNDVPGRRFSALVSEERVPHFWRKSEIHRDLCIDFYRIPIEDIRSIFPLLHRIDRGRSQHWISRDYPYTTEHSHLCR